LLDEDARVGRTDRGRYMRRKTAGAVQYETAAFVQRWRRSKGRMWLIAIWLVVVAFIERNSQAADRVPIPVQTGVAANRVGLGKCANQVGRYGQPFSKLRFRDQEPIRAGALVTRSGKSIL